MADTVRDQAAILALLADNTSGSISAQDIRDAVVTLWSHGWITLEQYGAAGDGTTDDSAALVAALATGSPILLGPHSYLIVGPITVPANAVIRGHGRTSTLKTTANATLLSIGGANVELRDFRILGNSTGASQRGIVNGGAGASSGYPDFICDGVRCDSLGADGMVLQQTLNVAGDKKGPRIDRFEAESCGGIGLSLATRAEYVVVTNVGIRACATGIAITGGNATITGGYVTDCTAIGVELIAGTNDSHGVMLGVEINHTADAGNAVKAGAIANGFTFEGCQIYYGKITLTSSVGVKFRGGQIDVASFNFDGSTGTEFDGVHLVGSLANTVNNDVNSHASETLWRPNCRLLTGVSPAYDQWVGAHTRVTLSANIAKTAAQFAAEFTVISDTLAVKALSRHTGFTYATLYNTGTGVWTVRGYGDGTFYLRGQVRLVVNAAETGIFYLYVKRNGAKVSPYVVGIHLTSTIIAFSPDMRIPCVPGDTFEITVGGGATLDDGLVASSEHFVETEGQ